MLLLALWMAAAPGDPADLAGDSDALLEPFLLLHQAHQRVVAADNECVRRQLATFPARLREAEHALRDMLGAEGRDTARPAAMRLVAALGEASDLVLAAERCIGTRRPATVLHVDAVLGGDPYFASPAFFFDATRTIIDRDDGVAGDSPTIIWTQAQPSIVF